MAGLELLCAPTAGAEDFSKPFKRKTCKYESKCGRFKVERKDYTKQYSHIYFVRLIMLRQKVMDEVKRKWDRNCEESLAQLSNKNGQECCIVGTIFKQMDLKPNILKEISASNHLIPQPPRVRYVSANDRLILEDQMQRVLLTWKEPADSHMEDLVTGVVVGLLGREKGKGEFEVEDVCYPRLPLQKKVPKPIATEDKYVLLVSGLNVGSSWYDQLSIEMLVDYITGQLGGIGDQQLCSSIVRVIVAGNSITDTPVKSSISISNSNQPRFLTRNYTAESLEAIKELDNILAQLVNCIPVDLMPGSHDPTSHQLPQQPMHRCMFPQAGCCDNLKGVTNPYSASIDGINFLGTSGQNVNDIYRFTMINDRLRILENTLRWLHITPTSPDTLGCFPYENEDPFIIEDCPHVYFAGNQPLFQKKQINGNDGQSVLLVCVPNFDLTHSCVLVNLNSLDCQEMCFTTSLQAKPNPALQRQREIETELEGGEGSLLPSQEHPEEEMSILHHMDQDDNFDD